ncbi:MAG: hypothetical protein Q8L87_00250 [Anaerolineales bacterium]|jgi:hypothetical protein|nr:hypothetical protein [Anaerolineales bacterium]
MKIKVFVRSFVLSANRDALHLAYDYHYFWQGEKNHHIYRGFMDKIWTRGRMPDHDSAKLLNEIQSLGIPPEDLHIHDVGALTHGFTAILQGVWKVPAVLVENKKAQGIEACIKLLNSLYS